MYIHTRVYVYTIYRPGSVREPSSKNTSSKITRNNSQMQRMSKKTFLRVKCSSHSRLNHSQARQVWREVLIPLAVKPPTPPWQTINTHSAVGQYVYIHTRVHVYNIPPRLRRGCAFFTRWLLRASLGEHESKNNTKQYTDETIDVENICGREVLIPLTVKPPTPPRRDKLGVECGSYSRLNRPLNHQIDKYTLSTTCQINK